jgi:hypothetical protein
VINLTHLPPITLMQEVWDHMQKMVVIVGKVQLVAFALKL